MICTCVPLRVPRGCQANNVRDGCRQDLSAQLVLKWDRFGPEHEIECIEDMARLTFDTIGLCAFGYRFNEFYDKDPHPFMKQLKESIVESGKRANRPEMLNHLYYRDEQHRQENIVQMRQLCTKIIRDRDEHPRPDAKDLLNVMLNGIDKETGEKLGVENIIYQIPTLLGGGYETTGATLCFIYYFMCSNPEKLRKAQQEVDEIVGDKVLTYDMLRQLKYLDACMKESLRLQHPVSLLTRFATKSTVMGGKYFIKKGQMVSGIWRHFHRDPEIWGEDADEFRPERMLDVNYQTLPPNSWKPVSAHTLQASNPNSPPFAIPSLSVSIGTVTDTDMNSSVTACGRASVVVLQSKRSSSTWQ